MIGRYATKAFLASLSTVLILSCSISRVEAESRRIGFYRDVIEANRISGQTLVEVGSVERASEVTVQVEIGPNGRVLKARVDHDDDVSIADAAPAVAAVREWRFRPFHFKGSAVTAVGSVTVAYKMPELWQDPNARLPPVDYDGLLITLERSACYGSCPDYRVQINGSGEVLFTTRGVPVDEVAGLHRSMSPGGVLIPGRHVSRIGRAQLDGLIERFRAAHFFGLKDEYRARITDNPSYVLTFKSGARSKRVVDYVGETVGMPTAVTMLENEVDRVAGTRRWITGDPETGAALAAEGFDFTSPAAANLLLNATRETPEEMVLDFLRRGVPLDAFVPSNFPTEPGQPESASTKGTALGQLLLEQSIRLQRPLLFRELTRLGWLKRTPTPILARAFVERGGGCSPDIAQMLVEAGVDPATRDSEGKTALMVAIGPYSCGAREVDRRPLVPALIHLGVPLNAVDKEGETALFKTENLALVQLLLAAGARADVRDKDGLSPAFSSWDDSVVLTLLEAGADPSGRNFEGKTLREVAIRRNMPGTLTWLNEHEIP